MVIAMMTAATTQATDIQTPPSRSQRMFSKIETGAMRILRNESDAHSRGMVFPIL
jgi:hypothetical protein